MESISKGDVKMRYLIALIVLMFVMCSGASAEYIIMKDSEGNVYVKETTNKKQKDMDAFIEGYLIAESRQKGGN